MFLQRLLLVMMATAVIVFAADEPVPLWPHPISDFKPGQEHDATTAKDNAVAGKKVIRLTNVSDPTLTFYPSVIKNGGATVVVFPGGGYRILALDLEGTEICDWLNSIGINAVLVKYRVPEPAGVPRYAAPLQDAQRAIGMVRANSGKWHIDSKRIGVIGFSAGGHLAALVSNSYATRTYTAVDAADGLSCRPDFTILIYPAYLTPENNFSVLAPEFRVTAQTPPTFLIQTEDDPIHVQNSLTYYRALTDSKVPAEMHLFSTGGHGYGLRSTSEPVTKWPKLVESWLHERGVIK